MSHPHLPQIKRGPSAAVIMIDGVTLSPEQRDALQLVVEYAWSAFGESGVQLLVRRERARELNDHICEISHMIGLS